MRAIRTALLTLAALCTLLAAHGAGSGSALAMPAGRNGSPRAIASGMPPAARALCRRLRARLAPLALVPGRRRLKVLATGDSMIYPLDEVLAIERPRRMRVVDSRHDGTGLTTNTVNWHALARRQAARIRPAATVISIGGRDGGIPLAGPDHQLVECCSSAWLHAYARLLRPLARAYLRGGAAQVYWLLLPAPREQARAGLFEAVNDAIELLAVEMGPRMHIIPTAAVLSPGGFQSTITFEGITVHPRAPDGIHLNHEGACVERTLVLEAMLADGQLVHREP